MRDIKTLLIEKYEKHRTAVWIFLFACVYEFAVPGKFSFWSANTITYAYHAVDYSMGFCTRILPGAVFNFIFKNPTQFKVDLFETVIFMGILIFVSLCLEKFYKKYEYKETLFMIFLFLTGPCTFSIFIKEFGMIDVFWIVFSVLFLCLLSKRGLYFFIIPLSVLCVLVNVSGVLSYMPFMFLVMMYKAAVSEKKGEKAQLIITAFLFVAAGFASLAYFLMYEKSNVVYDVDKFNSILQSRGADYLRYYDFYFYRDSVYVEEAVETVEYTAGTGLAGVYDIIIHQLKVTLTFLRAGGFLVAIPLIAPVVVLIFKSFIGIIKSEEKAFFKKLVLVGMMCAFFLTSIGGKLFSTDTIRWLTHGFLPLFASFFYVMYNEGKDAFDICRKTLQKYDTPVKIAYAFTYAIITFKAYN